jgi:pyruvate/2-oxoglutarate dehydrogenase complex dihydrolipoamide acyltransferase (E2) component
MLRLRGSGAALAPASLSMTIQKVTASQDDKVRVGAAVGWMGEVKGGTAEAAVATRAKSPPCLSKERRDKDGAPGVRGIMGRNEIEFWDTILARAL